MFTQPISTMKSLSTAFVPLFPRAPPSREAIKKPRIQGINSVRSKTSRNPSDSAPRGGCSCSQQHHLVQSSVSLPAPSASQTEPAPSSARASPSKNGSRKNTAQGQDVMSSNCETSTLKARLGEIL